jgi:hypothetical protein
VSGYYSSPVTGSGPGLCPAVRRNAFNIPAQQNGLGRFMMAKLQISN